MELNSSYLLKSFLLYENWQTNIFFFQQIAFKNLVERNKEREKREGPPPPNSAIQLPFIIVNTSKKTVIDCRYVIFDWPDLKILYSSEF